MHTLIFFHHILNERHIVCLGIGNVLGWWIKVNCLCVLCATWSPVSALYNHVCVKHLAPMSPLGWKKWMGLHIATDSTRVCVCVSVGVYVHGSVGVCVSLHVYSHSIWPSIYNIHAGFPPRWWSPASSWRNWNHSNLHSYEKRMPARCAACRSAEAIWEESPPNWRRCGGGNWRWMHRL